MTHPSGSCCAPAGGGSSPRATPARATAGRSRAPGPRSTSGQIELPGGRFRMGDHFDEGYPADGEVPVHPVQLAPFWMDSTAVTNAQFAAFVEETGHVTQAEEFGFSAVFHLALAATPEDIMGRVAATPWWLGVRGADWRHPDGPGSDVTGREDHPVVHVSWNDATAFADWAGKRLPTEAEWELASRGGLEGARFPWGDELNPDGQWLCNIWQGTFPTENTLEDGHLLTAPARSMHQNGHGLWSMVGNVWEWCADWFSLTEYAERIRLDGAAVVDPRGPERGEARVMRGGSFLCHDSYCYRYRVAARSSNTPDSSSANIGFRCANDGEPPARG